MYLTSPLFLYVSVGSSIWHPPCRQAAKQEEKSKVGGADCHVVRPHISPNRTAVACRALFIFRMILSQIHVIKYKPLKPSQSQPKENVKMGLLTLRLLHVPSSLLACYSQKQVRIQLNDVRDQEVGPVTLHPPKTTEPLTTCCMG